MPGPQQMALSLPPVTEAARAGGALSKQHDPMGGYGQEAAHRAAGYETAKAKRQKRVLANFEDVSKAVEGLDTARTGPVSATDLSNALTKLGIKMRKSEYRKLQSHLEGGVDQGRHKDRARTEKKATQHRSETRAGKWKGLKDANEAKIMRSWKVLQKEFKNCDPDRSGVVQVDTFLLILSSLNIQLENDEVDVLYVQFGRKGSPGMRYPDFLRAYAPGLGGAISAPPMLPDISAKLPPLALGHKSTKSRRALDYNDPTTREFLTTVAAKWKSIRQACMLLDLSRQKLLSRKDFAVVMMKMGLKPSESLLTAIMRDFGESEQQRFVLENQRQYKDEPKLVDYNLFLNTVCKKFLVM
eukprot:CAMPEP_0184324568 /NCGR_PEP_ID=MMETSP1049-20130417/135811_1 /TAXON_ID=77928 /ORGANISM="Proteomonas sulcata, Strain CCMP704" /LENGTH=355 /DNA_ID=CAMNT_0026646371 /DNA_START=32 /DNA_END=1099 /DNA_ORIENTATION=+